MDNRNQIKEKLIDIFEYKGTPVYLHFIELMDLLDEAYSDDMRTVKPENLGTIQGASKQLRLIKDSLVKTNVNDIPKL